MFSNIIIFFSLQRLYKRFLHYLFYLFIVLVCLCISVCYMYEGALGAQKRAPSLLELELHAVVTCLLWILGTEFRRSGKAGNTFNHYAILPVPV